MYKRAISIFILTIFIANFFLMPKTAKAGPTPDPSALFQINFESGSDPKNIILTVLGTSSTSPMDLTFERVATNQPGLEDDALSCNDKMDYFDLSGNIEEYLKFDRSVIEMINDVNKWIPTPMNQGIGWFNELITTTELRLLVTHDPCGTENLRRVVKIKTVKKYAGITYGADVNNISTDKEDYRYIANALDNLKNHLTHPVRVLDDSDPRNPGFYENLFKGAPDASNLEIKGGDKAEAASAPYIELPLGDGADLEKFPGSNMRFTLWHLVEARGGKLDDNFLYFRGPKGYENIAIKLPISLNFQTVRYNNQANDSDDGSALKSGSVSQASYLKLINKIYDGRTAVDPVEWYTIVALVMFPPVGTNLLAMEGWNKIKAKICVSETVSPNTAKPPYNVVNKAWLSSYTDGEVPRCINSRDGSWLKGWGVTANSSTLTDPSAPVAEENVLDECKCDDSGSFSISKAIKSAFCSLTCLFFNWGASLQRNACEFVNKSLGTIKWSSKATCSP